MCMLPLTFPHTGFTCLPRPKDVGDTSSMRPQTTSAQQHIISAFAIAELKTSLKEGRPRHFLFPNVGLNAETWTTGLFGRALLQASAWAPRDRLGRGSSSPVSVDTAAPSFPVPNSFYCQPSQVLSPE
jgi:hypothetical protein